MKILAIRGKNLASLEGEFAIDFRSEPLCSQGIFAITGPTGSGKSTLLDAMCISLYNNSPRINKVSDSADIYDIKDSTIKEKDCRNILRRGTADGYAETDFKAIDGKEYRARWSVRRSRNKSDGKLQDYHYALYNISDGTELSGTKTELLEQTRQLIGLTYEQFTRAVLLAQGDFATFLKASSREKAEILEKLTGTEIYTHISQLIYEKFKQAEMELSSIKERIKEISLLSEEEAAALLNEKKQLAKEKEATAKAQQQIQEKIKWIEQMTLLSNELEHAKKIYSQREEAMQKIEPLTKIIEKTENIQPIRDTYIKILTIKKEIKQGQERLSQYNNAKESEEKKLKETEELLNTYTQRQKELNEEWEVLQPKVREALKIETEQKNCLKAQAENNKKTAETKENIKKLQETLQALLCVIQKYEKEIEENNIWLNGHIEYSTIANKTEVLCSHVGEAENAIIQIAEKEKLLATTTELQKRYQQQLEQEHKERELLNATLSTEIATLRSRLVQGEPCPVCGSIHHTTEQITGNTLQEEQLTIAKSNNEKRIEHLTTAIESGKAEYIQLSSLIEGYKQILNTKIEAATGIIKLLPQYNNETEYNAAHIEQLRQAANEIKATAQQWNSKKERTTQLREQLSVELNKKANCVARLDELQTMLENFEKINTHAIEELEQYKTRLIELIGNDTTESIEQRHKKATEETGKKTTETNEKYKSQTILYTKTKQNIDTLIESIEKAEKEFDACKSDIQQFLSTQTHVTTLDELHKIATIAPEEILDIRHKIQEAKELLTTATATLEERTRNIQKHKQSPTQPSEEETKEMLLQEQAITKEKADRQAERMTQIDVILGNNNMNKALSQKLNAEYKAADATATDWKKLNDFLGSADGKKFRVIAQGYTLDILLAYSNKHLKELSSRYELARTSPDSLAIKVIDRDMLSESRSVHSLSGGESFLVSLALALALSSLSSNRMNIESLFIDEGFGSLDSDTLRTAMDALDRLQSQGRKIGVISHLSEMIERIPARIHIIKGSSGRSTIHIE